MAQAKSISLAQFTTAVQSAVKSAVQKHPKFKLDTPQGVSFNYLIRGIPIPETLLQNVSVAETQAFANEVAAQIGSQGVAVDAIGGGNGAIFSAGGHLIIGIPAVDQFLMKQ